MGLPFSKIMYETHNMSSTIRICAADVSSDRLGNTVFGNNITIGRPSTENSKSKRLKFDKGQIKLCTANTSDEGSTRASDDGLKSQPSSAASVENLIGVCSRDSSISKFSYSPAVDADSSQAQRTARSRVRNSTHEALNQARAPSATSSVDNRKKSVSNLTTQTRRYSSELSFCCNAADSKKSVNFVDICKQVTSSESSTKTPAGMVGGAELRKARNSSQKNQNEKNINSSANATEIDEANTKKLSAKAQISTASSTYPNTTSTSLTTQYSTASKATKSSQQTAVTSYFSDENDEQSTAVLFQNKSKPHASKLLEVYMPPAKTSKFGGSKLSAGKSVASKTTTTSEFRNTRSVTEDTSGYGKSCKQSECETNKTNSKQTQNTESNSIRAIENVSTFSVKSESSNGSKGSAKCRMSVAPPPPPTMANNDRRLTLDHKEASSEKSAKAKLNEYRSSKPSKAIEENARSQTKHLRLSSHKSATASANDDESRLQENPKLSALEVTANQNKKTDSILNPTKLKTSKILQRLHEQQRDSSPQAQEAQELSKRNSQLLPSNQTKRESRRHRKTKRTARNSTTKEPRSQSNNCELVKSPARSGNSAKKQKNESHETEQLKISSENLASTPRLCGSGGGTKNPKTDQTLEKSMAKDKNIWGPKEIVVKKQYSFGEVTEVYKLASTRSQGYLVEKYARSRKAENKACTRSFESDNAYSAVRVKSGEHVSNKKNAQKYINGATQDDSAKAQYLSVQVEDKRSQAQMTVKSGPTFSKASMNCEDMIAKIRQQREAAAVELQAAARDIQLRKATKPHIDEVEDTHEIEEVIERQNEREFAAKSRQASGAPSSHTFICSECAAKLAEPSCSELKNQSRSSRYVAVDALVEATEAPKKIAQCCCSCCSGRDVNTQTSNVLASFSDEHACLEFLSKRFDMLARKAEELQRASYESPFRETPYLVESQSAGEVQKSDMSNSSSRQSNGGADGNINYVDILNRALGSVPNTDQNLSGKVASNSNLSNSALPYKRAPGTKRSNPHSRVTIRSVSSSNGCCCNMLSSPCDLSYTSFDESSGDDCCCCCQEQNVAECCYCCMDVNTQTSARNADARVQTSNHQNRGTTSNQNLPSISVCEDDSETDDECCCCCCCCDADTQTSGRFRTVKCNNARVQTSAQLENGKYVHISTSVQSMADGVMTTSEIFVRPSKNNASSSSCECACASDCACKTDVRECLDFLSKQAERAAAKMAQKDETIKSCCCTCTEEKTAGTDDKCCDYTCSCSTNSTSGSDDAQSKKKKQKPKMILIQPVLMCYPQQQQQAPWCQCSNPYCCGCSPPVCCDYGDYTSCCSYNPPDPNCQQLCPVQPQQQNYNPQLCCQVPCQMNCSPNGCPSPCPPGYPNSCGNCIVIDPSQFCCCSTPKSKKSKKPKKPN